MKEYPVQGLTDVRLPQPKFPLETAGLVKGRVAAGERARSEMGQVRAAEEASDS